MVSEQSTNELTFPLLKVLLLDSDQLKLFEYIPKPILTNNRLQKLFSNKIFLNKVGSNHPISSNYFQEQWVHLNKTNSKKHIVEKISGLSSSYEHMKNKRNPSELDMKLLNLLDEDVRVLLEKREKIKEGTIFPNVVEEVER